MAATQCRSSKCTAERKGFRRELDSWRHKLIQCVGFESILEGIYGPRLLQDLNIFDECEPEDLDDWSIDANCSFCNLQLEKLNEHPAVPGSPPPAETPPPQGLSTSDKVQCQADRFLYAIFRKKEFPQSCDSSIPLVAQELMRRMIRRFALEYACKSQTHGDLNGLSDNSERLLSQPDPDGPLDLTVSRASPALQVDGVLDLSKKNTPSENETTLQISSGSLGSSVEDKSSLETEDGSIVPEVGKITVLEKVLSSLCSRHRLLLTHILKDVQEDYNISLSLRDAHGKQAGSLCCHLHKKLLNEAPTLALGDCSVTAGICCRTACEHPTCAFSPPCVSLRNVHGHSCQNTAIACVGQAICCNPSDCCTSSKPLSCQHQHNGDHTYISHARGSLIIPPGDSNSQNRHKGSRSPSPPPLSPKPVDLDYKIAVKPSIFPIQEFKAPNIAPPSLLPHRSENKETTLCSSTPLHVGSSDGCCEKVVTLQTQAEKDDHQCGSFIGDLMDRVTEQLKSIQPSEKEQNIPAHASQISRIRDDTHLTEIITTVLHNSSDKDYNLNDLLQQHVATEQRSPQTRSRKRFETLVAMSKSSDLPSSRRQSLQIKRDLARLSPAFSKRNTRLDWNRGTKRVKPLELTYSLIEQPQCRKLNRTVYTEPVNDNLNTGHMTTHAEKEKIEYNQETHIQHVVKEQLPPNERAQPQNTDSDQKMKAKIHKEKCLAVQVERTRRNIVPPQRFSSYVTEPRKMYFAACFSESIFTKHSSRDGTLTALGSTEEIFLPSDKCGKMEHEQEDCGVPQNNSLPKHDNLSKKEPLSECKNNERSPHKERKRKSFQNSTLLSKRSKCSRANSLNTEPHSPTISNFTTTESTSQAEASPSRLKYDSPIKLMFVSSVKGDDGIKYTLKAAASGSESHCEMFDPCVESSWAGSAIDDNNQDSVFESNPSKTVEHVENKCTLPNMVSAGSPLSSFSSESQEPLPFIHQTTPIKRRPGRPKKIGPQIVKSVKRPIGRPPKPKTTDLSSSTPSSNAVNQGTHEIYSKEDDNKKLKITILYGRSRRVRRVVSEDLGSFLTQQPAYEEYNGCMYSKTSTNDQTTKDQFKDLHLVMPIEDRKCLHSSSNIKCQRQSDIILSRKPGRPPKVQKISGISVTVTSGSPRQRKIHLKRDTKDSHLLRRTLELQPSKEQKTICIPTDINKDRVDAQKEYNPNTRRQLIPVRHSVRERKPSIHLLHSVATARSCALVRRSRKLLLNKASCEASQHVKNIKEEPPNNALSIKTKNVSSVQDIVRFSAISVNSIFSPHEGFRWWPTSASPETLNEELARRIKLMSNTWVSDVLEANQSGEIKPDLKPKTCKELLDAPKKSTSAIKMLFEKNYNMEKLCSWFMQSTETQSLAIVKKAIARNPKDVFHYSLSRPNCKVNACPSPQAERLRKHVKKFAKIVPKSPSMHKKAQEMLSKSARPIAKRKLFDTSSSFKQNISMSRGIWVDYRKALIRARQKFKTRHKIALRDEVCDQMRTSGAKTLKLPKEMPKLVDKPSKPVMKVQNALKLLVKTPPKMIGLSNISKQNRISSEAWSPESLKECRVFLKKINSPNTKSTTEECNVCTVKLYDVSEHEESEDITVNGTHNSPVQLPLSSKSPRKVGRKKGKLKNPSPSTKMLRQSRSCRGVLGARWCDFVLGSLK
nr:ligand-dependent nuclear receptor corepressor-like protein isoform X3 [Danio rerio]|eukprot:XP_021329575.1 ligand-dependent nuclear receptor corepressor-like protein isoform X3 [Danio rerio]